MIKKSGGVEKGIILGTLLGQRHRWRPPVWWLDITAWTQSTLDKTIENTENRKQWRRIDYNVANPQTEEDWRQGNSFHAYSRWMIFFSWCLTHWLVGDCGQPVSVWRQYQHTDASVVYARRSALMVLPDWMTWLRSSSPSKSLTYSSMNVRISTVSNISTGTSLNFYSKTSHQLIHWSTSLLQSVTSISCDISDWINSIKIWTCIS